MANRAVAPPKRKGGAIKREEWAEVHENSKLIAAIEAQKEREKSKRYVKVSDYPVTYKLV